MFVPNGTTASVRAPLSPLTGVTLKKKGICIKGTNVDSHRRTEGPRASLRLGRPSYSHDPEFHLPPCPGSARKGHLTRPSTQKCLVKEIPLRPVHPNRVGAPRVPPGLPPSGCLQSPSPSVMYLHQVLSVHWSPSLSVTLPFGERVLSVGLDFVAAMSAR